MVEDKKEAKEMHYSGGKSYFINLKSSEMPFSVNERKFKLLEKANDNLQEFVRLVEKKFDSVWYIGTDYFGEELFERFMFHHGGFMEISLSGEVRCFFFEDKIGLMKEAIAHALDRMVPSRRSRIMSGLKSGEKLISLKDSIVSGGKR
ncbi:MAG: hypothetical protein WCK90_04995 [archaeon]